MFVIQPLSRLKATMVAQATAIAMRKLGDAAVVKMLDTQGAYVHLHIFNKVNMLMVTTSLNPRNIQLLAHLIWKQIIIIFFNSEMLLGYLLDNI